MHDHTCTGMDISINYNNESVKELQVIAED
jgi:hypothetical protein